VPDGETIPAHLQRLFQEKVAGPVCVRNFGTTAWVSTQSLMRLIVELRRGSPDVVLFYNGVNDVVASYQNGHVEGHQNQHEIAVRFEERPIVNPLVYLARKSRVYQLFRSEAEPSVYDLNRSDTLAAETLRVYRENMRVARSLADYHGFKLAFFWQPVLSEEKKPLTEIERRILNWAREQMPGEHTFFTEAYRHARSLALTEDDLYDLTDTFVGETELVYIDRWHVTAEANAHLARAIFSTIWEEGRSE